MWSTAGELQIWITNHNGEHSSCRIHFQKFTHYQGPELLQSTNHQLSAQSDRRPVSVILKGKVYTIIPLRSYCQRLSEGWSVSAMVYLLCITTLTQHLKSYESQYLMKSYMSGSCHRMIFVSANRGNTRSTSTGQAIGNRERTIDVISWAGSIRMRSRSAEGIRPTSAGYAQNSVRCLWNSCSYIDISNIANKTRQDSCPRMALPGDSGHPSPQSKSLCCGWALPVHLTAELAVSRTLIIKPNPDQLLIFKLRVPSYGLPCATESWVLVKRTSSVSICYALLRGLFSSFSSPLPARYSKGA